MTSDRTTRYRRLEEADVPEACAPVMRCFEQFVGHEYPPDGVAELTRCVQPEAMIERLRSEQVAIVAEAGGMLAGIIELRAGSHVSLLFGDERHQGQGIARELFRMALGRVRQAGLAITEVTVHAAPGRGDDLRTTRLPSHRRAEDGERHRARADELRSG